MAGMIFHRDLQSPTFNKLREGCWDTVSKPLIGERRPWSGEEPSGNGSWPGQAAHDDAADNN
ncbi:hypothetical protein CKAN_01454500 [Cinnamomum micranthum f. kanehirae]|uniref:Uncharacterized protein n=1 Tax=Cinnamomum micranthum f. kanehirae TaxID=337451 RepID=A0A3S3P8W2_9MAGN|nr:hypothetical protein CKAN_01454500 [Cinnamomum micranthum f. kanehirae]